MENQKVPVWFWIVAVVALIWNLLGVMSYLAQAFMTQEVFETLPADQQELMNNTPSWVIASFAFAVFGGALGSIFLLMRRGFARILFIISFIGIVFQQIYSFFMSNSYEVYGPGGAVMALMILIFGAVLIYLSGKAKNNGWLR